MHSFSSQKEITCSKFVGTSRSDTLFFQPLAGTTVSYEIGGLDGSQRLQEYYSGSTPKAFGVRRTV